MFLAEARILGNENRNTAQLQRIRNFTNDWSSTDKDWNPVSEIRNPWRGIRNPQLGEYIFDFLFVLQRSSLMNIWRILLILTFSLKSPSERRSKMQGLEWTNAQNLPPKSQQLLKEVKLMTLANA